MDKYERPTYMRDDATGPARAKGRTYHFADGAEESFADGGGQAQTGAANPEWVPDEMLDYINKSTEDLAVSTGKSEKELARLMLQFKLPEVTQGIVQLALRGSNERVRLDASKYLMERVLGKVGDDAFDGSRSPLEEMFDDVSTYLAGRDESN